MKITIQLFDSFINHYFNFAKNIYWIDRYIYYVLDESYELFVKKMIKRLNKMRYRKNIFLKINIIKNNHLKPNFIEHF